MTYVQDYTAHLKDRSGNPRWPVQAAAERWDDGSGVDFRYTTKGCPKGARAGTER